jgi:L-ascorbate metabolism protein UlaG (beta-lactamase superfamily)
MRHHLLFFLIAAVPLPGEVNITCLANEGVLLTAGRTKVLIDSLFRDSLEDYARHEPAEQERIETGKPPFDDVTLALATHYHLDHWDAGAISRFLRMNPAAEFASTPQGTGMMPRALRSRVHALWAEDGTGTFLERPGVRVEAIPLTHGETQNLAFRVAIGDRVVVHLGDAEPTAANFKRLAAAPAPDIVLAPFWWVLDREGRAFLTARWKARHVIAFHFGAADLVQSGGKVRENLPGVRLCTRPGEWWTY